MQLKLQCVNIIIHVFFSVVTIYTLNVTDLGLKKNQRPVRIEY